MFLGIDWGGTYIKAGLVTSQGRIIRKEVYASDNLKKKRFFIENLERLLHNFKRFKVKGIGLGAPGIINIKRGSIYYLPNISGWKNFPLKNILRKKLGLPVFVDNDANVFALAEFRQGAGKGKSCGIFLTLGTGLGGAVIVSGRLLKRETSACELGHVSVSLEGGLCSCGGRGCIETYVGNRYLLEQYKKLNRHKKAAKDVKEIFERALKGEGDALLIWKEFSQNLGRFLAGMVNIFNPQIIVLGGGVAGAFKLFKPPLWQAIKEQAMWPQLMNLRLVKAKLKDAGIIGAAILAKEELAAEEISPKSK